VDNDPVVLTHARALLASGPEGAADYIDADLRDTAAILEGAARTLDFSQPVAILLLLVLHLIPDSDDPQAIVGSLMAAAAPGSYLVLTHPAADIESESMAEMAKRLNALVAQKGTMRDKAQITRFLDGLVLVEPGIVQPQHWRPAGPVPGAPVTAWSAVARKP
jgi:hypothetical protein